MRSDSTAKEDDDDEYVFLRHLASYSPPSDNDMLDFVVVNTIEEVVTTALVFTREEVLGVYKEIQELLLVPDAMYPSGVRLCLYREVWQYLITPLRTLSWDNIKYLQHMCGLINDSWRAAWNLMQSFEQFGAQEATLDHFVQLRGSIDYYRRDLLKFVQDMRSIPLRQSSIASLDNPMIDEGVEWLRELVRVYVKYSGQVPVTSRQMILHFRDYIEAMCDKDFFTVVRNIEYHLGNSSLDLILNNFERWMKGHYFNLPQALQLVFQL